MYFTYILGKKINMINMPIEMYKIGLLKFVALAPIFAMINEPGIMPNAVANM